MALRFVGKLASAALIASLGCSTPAVVPDGGDTGGTGGSSGGPDAAQTFGDCSGVQVGDPPRGPGGCCQSDTDCASPGFCLYGWCSRTCETTTDCGGAGGGPPPVVVGNWLACRQSKAP